MTFGEKLKEARKEAGLSQEQFAQKLSFNETREAIDLDQYEVTGNCRDRKDAVCYSKFSGADAIYPLIRRKRMSKAEWLVDLIAGAGIIQGADYLRDASAYYLVETGGKQLLVNVSADFISSRELANKVDPKKFDYGTYTFRKAPYQLITI